MRHLCFRDQTEQEFYQQTVPAANLHATRVHLDPPFLGGDRLEIEAHRAAFRDLTLTADRLDLLAAVVQAMVRCHDKIMAVLGNGQKCKRIVLTGGGAETIHRLLPHYANARVELVEEGSLCGVARLFQGA
jgi:sugar (pentulose or hexulose) kinase